MKEAIRCPKCLSEERMYRAPLGKVVRNPFADLSKAVYDDCCACSGTGYLPGKVMDSIRQNFPKEAERILLDLKWSMDHFYFMLGELYVGVERDGYCHS